jgi:hypothetical protein
MDADTLCAVETMRGCDMSEDEIFEVLVIELELDEDVAVQAMACA